MPAALSNCIQGRTFRDGERAGTRTLVLLIYCLLFYCLSYALDTKTEDALHLHPADGRRGPDTAGRAGLQRFPGCVGARLSAVNSRAISPVAGPRRTICYTARRAVENRLRICRFVARRALFACGGSLPFVCRVAVLL